MSEYKHNFRRPISVGIDQNLLDLMEFYNMRNRSKVINQALEKYLKGTRERVTEQVGIINVATVNIRDMIMPKGASFEMSIQFVGYELSTGKFLKKGDDDATDSAPKN